MAFSGIFCWGRGKYMRCKGRCLYPHISTATHSAHSWGDMTESRCTTVCPFPPLPFAMFTPSRTLSFSSPLLHLSLEHVYYIDTWAILPFLLPIQSNFVIIEKRKKRKLNLSSTTCSLQTHSPSCIFGALQTLSGKNCSGLGHIASSVTGRPYKEKDNRKWVKNCR